MLSELGLSLQPYISAGSLVTWALILLAVWWVRGIPDRMRASNEARVIDNADIAARLKDWRTEVHGLKNELAKVAAKQAQCDSALAEAHSVNRQNHDRMTTMMFIIRLLISELKRLDPKSVIVKQAEETLVHMNGGGDPNKSDALNAAEHTVEAAKETCEEVKRVEGEGK